MRGQGGSVDVQPSDRLDRQPCEVHTVRMLGLPWSNPYTTPSVDGWEAAVPA